jgi:RNA-directed DNA polymerase
VAETKPYSVSKQVVLSAYQKVKANKGAAGVDDESLAEFGEHWKDNLYKIWNRMSSGTYFPPPVKRVEIPKKDGRKRPLGIPTVADRVAQMVVKLYLEPVVEPQFHQDSYGYRPGKSALEAVGVARKRCWQKDWVVDLDIKGFFDTIDHDLMMRAVRKHTDSKWILLYIERWLKAPVAMPDGTIEQRTKGTPQGGVISPLLANIFLHHAFDRWMEEKHASIEFERYADDIIVHCVSGKQAEFMKKAIEERLRSCKLELHPEKTKVVYCKDDDRSGEHPQISFDFLGYTFQPRKAKTRQGTLFLNYSPAASRAAIKSMGEKIRSWRLKKRIELSLKEVALQINATVRGWINYYGKYRPSALFPIFAQLVNMQVQWARRKYKNLRSYSKAKRWLTAIAKREQDLFVHWQWWYRMGGGITRAV